MNKYCQTKLQQLNDQIDELDWEQDNFLCIAETAVGCILKFTSEIKDYIINRGFKTLEEEIHFFKHYKPQFLAKLIYYNAIYKLETKKPYGNKNIRRYFDNELSKLKRFFDNNIDFYKYYRTNCTYLDHKYFVRGKYDIFYNALILLHLCKTNKLKIIIYKQLNFTAIVIGLHPILYDMLLQNFPTEVMLPVKTSQSRRVVIANCKTTHIQPI